MVDDASEGPVARKRKLTAAQLAHKRELDRRAQRTNREKTKNRITHLEKLVEALQGSDDKTTAFVQQIDRQKEEIDRLQGLLGTIANLVGEPKPPDNPQRSEKTRLDSISTSASAGDIAPPIQQVKHEDEPDPAEDNGTPSASPATLSSSAIGHVATGEIAPAKTTYQHRAARESLTQMASAIISKTSLEGRMWYVCGVLLRHILATVPPSEINYEHDEDIAIRAIFEGWSSVMERYPLDKGWQWLKEVDERIYFHRCEPFRLMHLRNCRLIFLRQMFRDGDWNSLVPPFFAPRPAEENIEHDPLIEYFPWPGLRERMVFSPMSFATNKFMDNLRCEIEFLWSDNPHQLYDWNPETRCYSYSDMYYDRIVDLRCYPGTTDFFSSFPELKGDIPHTPNGLRTLRLEMAPSTQIFKRKRTKSHDGQADDEDSQRSDCVSHGVS